MLMRISMLLGENVQITSRVIGQFPRGASPNHTLSFFLYIFSINKKNYNLIIIPKSLWCCGTAPDCTCDCWEYNQHLRKILVKQNEASSLLFKLQCVKFTIQTLVLRQLKKDKRKSHVSFNLIFYISQEQSQIRLEFILKLIVALK